MKYEIIGISSAIKYKHFRVRIGYALWHLPHHCPKTWLKFLLLIRADKKNFSLQSKDKMDIAVFSVGDLTASIDTKNSYVSGEVTFQASIIKKNLCTNEAIKEFLLFCKENKLW